jgi:flagellar biogenesis protein FliO
MKLIGALLLSVVVVASPVAAEPASNAATSAAKLEQVRAIAAERAALKGESGSEGSTAGWSSTGDISVGGTALKMFTALGVTIGALLIGLHLYRRFTGTPAPARARRLRVVERLPISGKTAIVLVEFDGRPMILSVGGETVVALEPQVSELSDVDRLCRDEAVLTAVGS